MFICFSINYIKEFIWTNCLKITTPAVIVYFLSGLVFLNYYYSTNLDITGV